MKKNIVYMKGFDVKSVCGPQPGNELFNKKREQISRSKTSGLRNGF